MTMQKESNIITRTNGGHLGSLFWALEVLDWLDYWLLVAYGTGRNSSSVSMICALLAGLFLYAKMDTGEGHDGQPRVTAVFPTSWLSVKLKGRRLMIPQMPRIQGQPQ